MKKFFRNLYVLLFKFDAEAALHTLACVEELPDYPVVNHIVRSYENGQFVNLKRREYVPAYKRPVLQKISKQAAAFAEKS